MVRVMRRGCCYESCLRVHTYFASKETLSNCLRGMKRKAHGAQEPRHIERYVEITSTAQRSDSPAQAINQSFPKAGTVK